MNRFSLILCLCCFAQALAIPNVPSNARLLGLLDHEVVVYQVDSAGNSTDEFHALCRDLKISCGEEKFFGEIDIWPPASINVWRREKMTLRSALARIIKKQPQYEWHISDGVLMLAPRIMNKYGPLDRHVAHYKTESNYLASVIIAMADLAGVEYASVMRASSASADESTVSLDVRDASVRFILNSAVRAHGSAMWTFTYTAPSESGKRDYLSVDVY
jgi:hypothetical protein